MSFLSLFVANSFAQSGSSQSVYLVSDSNGSVIDTTANATTDSKVIALNGGKSNSLSIQFAYTRLSGTAGGTIYLSQSNDGTNFKPITGDSLTVANAASGSYFWEKTDFKPKFVKVTYVGTGTMSVKWSTPSFYRRD